MGFLVFLEGMDSQLLMLDQYPGTKNPVNYVDLILERPGGLVINLAFVIIFWLPFCISFRK